MPVTLIHDQASAELAELAAEALRHRAPARIALESLETDGEPGPGQYILLYDLQLVDRAIEWQDRIVEVVVTSEGFRWEDRTFPSLSAAATAIAGTRWNGPRFFGLRGGAK